MLLLDRVVVKRDIALLKREGEAHFYYASWEISKIYEEPCIAVGTLQLSVQKKWAAIEMSRSTATHHCVPYFNGIEG
jgi:hypothetical protein